LRLRFLGTGTSFGIPVIGCTCRVCTSSDTRDRRSRHGAVLEAAHGSMLIDTPPELRLQLLAAGVTHIDAVFFTHAHADHVHGIDDLRVFSARMRRKLPAWADPDTAAYLRDKFSYIFDPAYRPPEGTTRPEITLETFRPCESLRIAGFQLTPFPVVHGDMTAYGFRTGSLGYVTDAKSIPAEGLALLRGVDVLVLNALWSGNPHPTHLNIEEAVELSRALGARRTFLTHLTHRVKHDELLARLPAGIAPAHDGLVVDIDDAATRTPGTN
jgi:phosphoribosyl 1,2-cyclic phosphate phosphodiesterase